MDEKRTKLEEAIDFAREGDILVVTKLDRLARSVADLVDIERRLKRKKAALAILDPALDTHTSTGRLLFNLIGSIAQFEREIMLERQRVGMAKAKAEGRFMGRKPTVFEKASQIRALFNEGVNPTDIAKRTRVARSSVYRILNADPEYSVKMRNRLARWGKAAS